MNFHNVAIDGWASYLPQKIVTSDDIEQRLSPVYDKLGLPYGRLELMTGIKERRHWDVGTTPSSLSSAAAEELFKQNPAWRDEVDLLIHASVCRDFLEPATASVVHENLKLNPNCTFFDLSNACLGVLNSIVVAAKMIESGSIKRALIVSGENGAPLLEQTISRILNDETINRKNIKKLFANLTIGSAAVAFTLTKADLTPNGLKLLGGASMVDSSANHLCRGDGSPHSLTMETDSEALMKAGVALAKSTWQQAKKNLGLKATDSFWAIGHQVGSAHEALTMNALELSQHPTHITYPVLGNTGSAALPITLIDLLEKLDGPKVGETIALLGIGSGLSCVMLGVRR
ncbi:MAG: 3-oxoacyl-ACP synthase III [Halobacteriovorax sp.]|nr:3-oxoacyl-ACP synthase III [Halobacteriovorax sp.]